VNAPEAARVVFTSSGTEANALALVGCGRDQLFAPRTEHPSVLNARGGHSPIYVDRDGLIDPFLVDEMLAGGGDDVVFSVMLANNETGVLQPVAGVAHVAHRYHALVHTDAVQAAGKVPVDFQGLGVDMLSLSAHKLGGPQGVGALIVAPGVDLTPLMPGGGQEKGLRGGTENVPGIAGFGAAAEAARLGLADEMTKTRTLRDFIESEILANAPDARVIAHGADRLPNTSLIVMPGVDGETQVMHMDLAGIAVSAGSACASGKTKISPVLSAMGVPAVDARSALRVSLGAHNDKTDAESFISAWMTLYQRKRKKKSAA
ncbi:MAG: cysteine desulfurase, partial [Alphaproteobacteria bacterium]|nr:cysteine desulfurase [Alphaproteobacteria bacterium]